VAGTSKWRPLPSNPPVLPLTLPRSLLVAARGPGGAGIPPALRFGVPKLAALALALISPAYAPPSAATRDYTPSRGDGLRPATRRA